MTSFLRKHPFDTAYRGVGGLNFQAFGIGASLPCFGRVLGYKSCIVISSILVEALQWVVAKVPTNVSNPEFR